MKSLIKILLLLLPVMTYAQFDPNWGYINRQQADSLKKCLNIQKNDTLLMAANRSLGFYYQETKLDSALYFHQQQLKLAKKLNIKMWLVDAYSQVGYLFYFMGNTTEGYNNFIEAKKIADDEKNETSSWHPWVFSNALSLHDARLAVLAMNDNGLGSLYYAMDEPAKGMDTYKEGIRFGEQIKNGKILSTIYGNIAQNLSADSMIQYSKKAIQYEDESGYKKNSGINLLLIAQGFYLKNEIDSAVHYVYSSIKTNIEQNNLRALSNSYWAIAQFHGFQHNLDSCLFYAKKILSTAGSTQVPGIFLIAYTSLANVYGLKKNNDSAFKYEQLAYNLNDSLRNVRIKQLTDFQKSAFNEQLQLKKLNDDKTAYQNKIKLYGAIGALIAVLIVAFILFRNNRQKQKANLLLYDEKQKVESTLSELKSTQQQLIQSEKMASLGELTAGIAHEIQNPLNFVNNFSEVSVELTREMVDEVEKGNNVEVKLIADDLIQNLEKINHHGKRADAIVKGMLQHSRSSSGVKEPTHINALCDEYLRLAYHGLRAKDKSFNATLKTDYDHSIGNIDILSQDMGRVILNLITNAFYAVHAKALAEAGAVNEREKLKASSHQLPASSYQPTVTVSTQRLADRVEVKVEDNGNGIPQSILDKIFQPFFTTKPTGQGTGLGLSMSYDIVKAHGGELKVETKEGKGSTFIIKLPVHNS